LDWKKIAKDGKSTLSTDKINRGQVKKEKQNLNLFFFWHIFIADGGSPMFVCQKRGPLVERSQ